MTQNETVYNPFSSYFQQCTVNRTESNEEDRRRIKIFTRSRIKMMRLRNTGFIVSRLILIKYSVY
jgi:hypothetical protein